MKQVWIFHGAGGKFTSGVFSTREIAEKWIATYKLEGLLTAYYLDYPPYDWSIQNNYFEADNEKYKSSRFIQKFTSGSQEHYHYANGELDE